MKTHNPQKIEYDFDAYNRTDIDHKGGNFPVHAHILMKEGMGSEITLESSGATIRISDNLLESLYHELSVINYMPFVQERWKEFLKGDDLDFTPLSQESCRNIASNMVDYLQTIGDEYEIEALSDELEEEAENMGLIEVLEEE